jgi:uncharacterized protein YndB with AHSA1/START domain
MPVSTASASVVIDTTERELLFTRVFDAPRELVFEAWTNPKHVGQWWGPRGFSTTTQSIDVRPGGVWKFVMHGPDGVDYHNRIVFLEVVKPERLVYKHDPEVGDEPVRFQVTVRFSSEGGKTRLTMQMLFPSAAAREHIEQTYGAVEGAQQTLERLREHLPKMAAENTARKRMPQDLVITRIFHAPRELVFMAWTDPEHLKQWWGPKDFTNPICELDLRPGGAIRIHMRAPDGTLYPMMGVFHEIVTPERLVFTTAALDKQGNPMFEVLTRVTFIEYGERTELTLTARVVKAKPAAAPYLSGMEQGWNQSLDRLALQIF